MFAIDQSRRVAADLPAIVEGYYDLHYDVMPILYAGFNSYGARVLGSSVDEDFDVGIARHFRILVTQDDYSEFLDHATTYRSLLENAQSVFVLDYGLDETLLTTYLVPIAEIPEEYLPTHESYAPIEDDAAHEQVHRISLNGNWSLTDLSDFPDLYQQVYSFVYSLDPQHAVQGDAYTAHPWAGGYSSLNFYTGLYASTPANDRPTVRRIVYASPGFIELVLQHRVALEIREQVRRLAEDIPGIEALYRATHSELKRRGLLGHKAPARDIDWIDHTEFVRGSLSQLAERIGLVSIGRLEELTGNALVALKILLSYYRRLRQLAEYELAEKLTL